jgi:hypothetical protein
VSSPAHAGYVCCVSRPSDRTAAAESDAADAKRRRQRQVVLDTLREAEQLRARLRPRTSALARSRTLLHNRTTRG